MTSFYPLSGFSQSSFGSGLLIVPSVSLANLPQLAVDILITSLGLTRVGIIGNGETVVPFFGPGEGSELVTGGLEVYGDEQKKIYVIQQRSPALKTKKDEHVDLVKQFISINKFAFTLLLTSLNAANQDDAQLLTPHQYLLPPTSTPTSTYAKTLASFSPLLDPSQSQIPYPPFLPSAGLTRRYLASLQDVKVELGALMAWCVEGDNRDDARALAAASLHVLGQGMLGVLVRANEPDVELKEPKAWEGLFGVKEGWSGGAGSNAELYG